MIIQANVRIRTMIRIWLLIVLLSGCSITLNKPTVKPVDTVQVIPDMWQAKGRVGGIVDQQVQNSGFDIIFKGVYYKLTLSAVLGLGQVLIESNPQGLWIDGKLIPGNFKQWMTAQVGWYFPITELTYVVFKGRKKMNNDWDVEISRYQQINNIKRPKLIRLKHLKKPIKIKLMLADIMPINK